MAGGIASVPESLLLSTGERYAVTLGLVTALTVPMAGLALAAAWLGAQPHVFAITASMAMIVLSSASMPLLSDVAQRAVLRGPVARLLLHLALGTTHVAALLITVFAVLFWIAGPDLDVGLLGPSFLQNLQSGFLCYAATAGMVRAIQWYRSSSLADAERRALESARLEKARDLMEQTLRPGMVGEALQRIRSMLPDRPADAERIVRRLARHGRTITAILAEGGATAAARLRTLRSVLLLHGTDVELSMELDSARGVPLSLRNFAVAAEELAERFRPESVRIAARAHEGRIVLRVGASGAGAAAFIDGLSSPAPTSGWLANRVAGEELEMQLPDDAPPEAVPPSARIPATRSTGSLYMWVVVFAGAGTFVNLYATTLPPGRMTSWADVAAAWIWLVAAVPLISIAGRIATLRWWIAAPALLSAAWTFGIAVSFGAVSAATAYTEAMSIAVRWSGPVHLLPMVARQNVLIACAIAGVSFALANGRRLLAAQAAVGRTRRELASAELRNLEARIQPHFLFNALVSLLALIRIDPERAARMCDLLRDLFARSVAASGVHEWPLREEIALTTDYLAIQHIRFGERLVVETAIDSDLHDEAIPRLLLQPLVENAVKHGVARRETPTRISIGASRRGGALHLTVANDCDVAGVDAPPVPGGGLTFVRGRVAAAGGAVAWARASGTFRVRCVLPAPGVRRRQSPL